MTTPTPAAEARAVGVLRAAAGAAGAACNTRLVSQTLVATCTALLAAWRTAVSAADRAIAGVLAALAEVVWFICA